MTDLEAQLGVLLVRWILPLANLGVLVWAHVRISRSMNDKLQIPDDMKANVKGLKHEVAELDESLQAHVSKHRGRMSSEKRKERAEAGGAAPAVAALEPPRLVGNPNDPEYVKSLLQASIDHRGKNLGDTG